MCGESARTRRSFSAAVAAGSSVRSAASIFSAYVTPVLVLLAKFRPLVDRLHEQLRAEILQPRRERPVVVVGAGSARLLAGRPAHCRGPPSGA